MSNQETEQIYAEVVETVENSDYSPLDAPVKQRNYTNHKVDANQVMPDLDEPTFQPPSYTDFEEPVEQEREPERPFNEAYSELDGKEKKMGAKMMAEMTLDLYEKGCGLLGKIPEISEAKLDRLIAEGEINADITLATENGNIPIKEFAVDYNDSIKDAFGVTDEFKEKVKPPLIRVFEKRGIGMTDEQLLMYYFAVDLGAKGVQAVMLKKTANSILDSLRENTIAIRESQMPKQQPVQQAQPVQQEQPAPKRYESEATEVVSEAVVMDRPRPTPKTNLEEQVQTYFEPEEGTDSVYANLTDGAGFKDDYVAPSGMPEFGDKHILSELERLSGQPTKPVRKTRATTTTAKKRTPRTKK